MSVNVEDIMSEIRSDIKKKGLNNAMLSFADVQSDANPENSADAYDPDTLRGNVQYVSSQYQLNAYRPLSGNPVKVFFQKVIRKLVKFYIEPIAQDQTYFNANSAQALQELELYIIDSQSKSTADLSKQIDDLKLQQKNNRIQIESMQKQIEILQKELSEYKKEGDI
ncbi:MAG: hypothetical protein IJZ64_06655 [Ruminococcus sp.]|nr:hypothetical protein [Ruminococcus sp.]